MLSDLLKDRLNAVDDLLLKAMREVFEEAINSEKPQDIADNALLGEKYRAYLIALRIIEKGFIDLMSYKINKSQDKTFNKER